MRKFNSIIISFVLLSSVKSYSQHRLVLQYHVFNDGIAFRWTPSDIALWRHWNEKGYFLERYTISETKKANSTAILINGGPITSQKIKDSTDNNTAFIKACLEAETQDYSTPADIVKANDENIQKHTLAMLLLQKNYELTLQSGLGYIDAAIEPQTIYLYKLYPADACPEDTILTLINTAKQTTPEPPEKPIPSISGNSIFLQWPSADSRDYFAFIIEKSSDSAFTNSVNTAEILNQCEPIMRYIDTGYTSGQTIFYRIKGQGYFNNTGPASPYAEITPFTSPTAYPAYFSANTDNKDSITLQWQFEPKQRHLIRGYMLYESDSIEGIFLPIDSVQYPANTEKISIKNTLIKKPYLKTVAIDLNGNSHLSHSLFLPMTDSTPPDAPDIVLSEISSSGIVKIIWKNNCKTGDAGYRIYKAYNSAYEFTPANPHYYSDTVFSDTLFLKMIRDSVYYKITALDDHYNESAYSKTIALKIPDIIPPDAPIIYNISEGTYYAKIKWHCSEAGDIDHYELSRSNEETGASNTIMINPDSCSYTDSTLLPGKRYYYSIKAVDKGGFSSKTSPAFPVFTSHEYIMPPITHIKKLVDTAAMSIHFYWNYDYEGISHYKIIRINTDRTISTIGTTSGDEMFFTYRYIPPIITCEYRIIAYFKDGRKSHL